MRKAFFLGLSLLFCVSLNAQKGTMKKALKKFELGEYESAIEIYKKNSAVTGSVN